MDENHKSCACHKWYGGRKLCGKTLLTEISKYNNGNVRIR